MHGFLDVNVLPLKMRRDNDENSVVIGCILTGRSSILRGLRVVGIFGSGKNSLITFRIAKYFSDTAPVTSIGALLPYEVINGLEIFAPDENP